MFTTINNPHRPWPTLCGLTLVTCAVALVVGFQVFLPQVLELQRPLPPTATFHLVRLAKTPKVIVAAARDRKEQPAAAAKVPAQYVQRWMASALPGTAQWRRHAERGRSLDFGIVAEQSLPVLRAYGVPLAMDVRRPRGKTWLYNLRDGSLSLGVVAEDAVPREVEGLPIEFDEPLREAERELGARPRVWALYGAELYNVLRSLTEDALQRKAVPMDVVRTARVRLSLAGGGAFAVELINH
jgi:hypothetical protein